MAMITDYTPGAYVTHDMLHMRGGHQVDWLIDGVPLPNTNIATNLGPQIDPKDIDYLEVQRGSYDAQYGDRTYGIFNIVPRSGFERDNEAELVASFGNWNQTNDQINFGGHTDALRLLWESQRKSQRLRSSAPYRASGSRRGKRLWGIRVLHIQRQSHPTNFGWSPRCARIITRSPSTRIPTQPEIRYYPSYGLHDSEHEPDGYVAFSWLHTFNQNLRMTVSPFYHYNQASYSASPNDCARDLDGEPDRQLCRFASERECDPFEEQHIEAGVYGFVQRQSNYLQ